MSLFVGDELWHHRGGEFQRAAGLVVDRGHVEGLEEVGELFGSGGLEAGPEVWHGGEHGLDLVGPGTVGLTCFEVADGLRDGGSPGAELLDAPRGEGDNGVAGVVVLLQAQRLTVEGAVDVVELEAQPGEPGVVLAPGLRHERRIERLLSVHTTCRLQRRPLHDYLVQALAAHSRGDPAPLLA